MEDFTENSCLITTTEIKIKTLLVWQGTPTILVLEKLRQGCHEFEVSLGSIASPRPACAIKVRGWVVSFNKHTGREKFKAFTTLVEQASRSLPSRFLNCLVNETESPQLGALIGSNLFFPSWVFCEEELRLLDFLIRKCFTCILYVLKFYLLKFITILKPLVGCIFDPWLIYKGVVSSYKCEEFPCYLLINI